MQPREDHGTDLIRRQRNSLAAAIATAIALMSTGCDAPDNRRDYRAAVEESDESLQLAEEREAEQTTEFTTDESVMSAEKAEEGRAEPAADSITTRPRAPVPMALENCFYDVVQTTTVGATEVSAGNCGVNGAITACMCNSTQSDRYIRSMFPTEFNGSGVDDGQSQALAGSCKCRFSGGLTAGNTYESYALCCLIH